MITWEFYSNRKGVSLESYLEKVETYDEAVALFRDRKMTPPKDLKTFFLERSSSVEPPKSSVNACHEVQVSQEPEPKDDKKTTSVKRTSSRSTSKKPTTRKRSTRKTKSQTSPESKETKDPEVKSDDKKAYFRKIIKPEKK